MEYHSALHNYSIFNCKILNFFLVPPLNTSLLVVSREFYHVVFLYAHKKLSCCIPWPSNCKAINSLKYKINFQLKRSPLYIGPPLKGPHGTNTSPGMDKMGKLCKLGVLYQSTLYAYLLLLLALLQGRQKTSNGFKL